MTTGGHVAIKVGALVWNQYTDWSSLESAGLLVDRLGFDSLWTWDHLYPIEGDEHGPILEAYMIIAAWAALTTRPTIGLMVGANTFRNPALVAKMVTTLDHISRGRAVLGIGGAWFGPEHDGFGIDFGSGFGERLDRLDEAVELMRGMLRGKTPSARGPYYSARSVRNDPPPIQDELPILIGGSGERKTLATVARYGDAWNVFAGRGIEEVLHKDRVLRDWCERVGRDEAEIERTTGTGAIVIRDTVDEARHAAREIAHHNRGWSGPTFVGPPEMIAERLAPVVAAGFRHVIIGSPAPHDSETLERFITEVKPRLENA
jgi:alkanesulfonate monooxygenase SsuD/methylene tetrahydromethanopterin reductase-like flavin-dependent oxidoreductase (luciferase family)